LRRNADEAGDKAAIVFNGQTTSWRELWEGVKTASAALSSKLDSRQQQVVAILEPNSVEFIICYLAVLHAGHIAMPLDITFKKLELDSVISSVRPDLILTRRDRSEIANGRAFLIEELLSTQVEVQEQGPRLGADKQIATLFLSSGTTGQPKTVPNTHSNILWDIKAISGPMDWTADDSLLITLHLSHRHGLVICLLGALYHGNTVYLEERFSPQTTLDLLQSGKISVYSAVPSIYESLVRFEPGTKFDLSTVRLFASSSSPLPPFLRREFQSRFGRQIMDRYGTSETGSISITQPSESASFGQLLDGVKVRIEQGGGIALSSPGLFPGYYRNPEATRKNTTADGWWLTGDIGELKDGKLALKGRSMARIIKSGYTVYPQDIEWALSRNSQVKVVSVLGMQSPGSIDDKVVAFYEGAADGEELKDYSKQNLPRSWRPDHFVRLDKLPRGRNGKVLIGKLREMAEQNA
jgi:acyl-CoA synthetase (AMP-forming)/AMP-acid ligase II